MESSAKHAAILLLPLALAGCAGDGQNSITYTDDRGVANQPYPDNYRSELLAFMKTYLNNPVGVKDAAMAGTAKSAAHAAPVVKSAQVKPSVLNANAKMGRHHHRHGHHYRHHRHHRHHR